MQQSVKPERDDYLQALREMDVYTDVSADDIMDIQARAEKYARLRAAEGARVANLMSHPVISVSADLALAVAAELLITHRISGLPVVDAGGRLCGIVTEADFMRALGVPAPTHGHTLWQLLEQLFVHAREMPPAETGRVADVMTRDVVTVRPQQTLHDVLDAMRRHQIKRVVVCDDDRHALGMVTRSDLVRAFFGRLRRPAGA